MQQAISYRDRDGFIVVTDQTAQRYVHHSYAKTYDQLMQSGLYQRLVGEGLLISHVEKSLGYEESIQYYKILEPQFLPFISYPYEWTASQWKEALLNLLKINSLCIEYGIILKDATPFNFSFLNGQCIFIDTLSFEIYQDGEPWTAYRQFCESMLGPSALAFFNDVVWIRMMQSFINGWPLQMISANLPAHTWLNSSLLFHIHLHCRFSKKNNNKKQATHLSKEKLLVLWSLIEKSVRGWNKKSNTKVWVDYYDTGILSKQYFDHKLQIVTEWLKDVHPKNVIDLGANNGVFSIAASYNTNNVIAVEFDHDCVEQLRIKVKKENIENIETVYADITQPSAAVGWDNKERNALVQRLRGDMVLSLALIHHLCISANIPIHFVADLFANMTTRYALVEFIPRSDPKVETLLLNRKDIFPDYTEENFIKSFNNFFRLVKSTVCNFSERKLFLWEKK